MKKFLITAIFSLFLFVALQATIPVTTSCGKVYYTCGACYDNAADMAEDALLMDKLLCGE
jgi:bacterioferritin-associated ferredoxin